MQQLSNNAACIAYPKYEKADLEYNDRLEVVQNLDYANFASIPR